MNGEATGLFFFLVVAVGVVAAVGVVGSSQIGALSSATAPMSM